ncbi:MAG: PKD domain-containing protein [Bacteroidota bacterium]
MSSIKRVYIRGFICLVCLALMTRFTYGVAMSPPAPAVDPLAPESYGAQCTLTWHEPTDENGMPVPGIAGYTIQRSTDGNFTANVINVDVGSVTSHQVTGLSLGMTYYFRVYARDTEGNPNNMNPWDAVSNPTGVRWSQITRTTCIADPGPGGPLAPVIQKITPPDPPNHEPAVNTYYCATPNPAVYWSASEPVPVPMEAISGGEYYSLGLKRDGTIWAWGINDNGQLGDGTTANSAIPLQVKGIGGAGYLTEIADIFGARRHALAVGRDGTVYAWGNNSDGQLGNGTISSSLLPSQVLGPGGGGLLTGVTKACGGYFHSLALKADGTVWAWGKNNYGQLGDGTTTGKSTPVQVKGPGGAGFLTNVVAIGSGAYHSLAVKADGTVWAWGNNQLNQLGDGTATHRYTPVQVKGPGGAGYLTGVTAVSGGNYHAIALKGDGTVWAWGYNNHGQLGNETYTDSAVPVQVKGALGVGNITNVKTVYGCYWGATALKHDGTIWTWGYNNYGQLGNGTTADSNYPVKVKGAGGSGYVTDAVRLGSGHYHSIYLKQDRTPWGWGYNYYGQLGDGTAANRSYPTAAQIPATYSTGQQQVELSVTELRETPGVFVEYPRRNVVSPDLSYQTDWNLPDGRYALHVRAANNVSWSPWSNGAVLAIDTVPPSLAFGTVPPVADTSLAVSAAAMDAVAGVAKVTFHANGQAVEDTSAPYEAVWDCATWAAGYYDISAQAVDKAGNATGTVWATVEVRRDGDTEPPSIPMNLLAEDVTDTTVTLIWSASTDNMGVTGYKVYRDGTETGTSTDTRFVDTELTPNATYTYTVSAFDAADNESDASTPITVTTLYGGLADLTVVEITAPASAAFGQTIAVDWSVRNAGTNVTTDRWADRVFLSASPAFNPAEAIYLGTTEHNGILIPGGTYAANAEVTLPNGISGSYYVHVWTDYADQAEEGDENNNTGTSAPMAITLAPTPDLQVSSVSATPSGIVAGGSEIEVGWAVHNIGEANAGAIWHDNVYLSPDPVWPGSAVLVGRFLRPSPLIPGAGYSQTRVVTIPADLPAQDYFIYVSADADNVLYEHNAEQNNTGRSAEAFNLTPGTPAGELLTNPGFEDGLAGWWTCANWSLDATYTYAGDQAALCVVPSGTETSLCQGRDFGKNIAGREFTVSAWIKSENIAKIRLRLCWRDAENHWLWRDVNSANLSGTEDWKKAAVTGVAPGGATQAWLLIEPVVRDGAGRFWVDQCSLWETLRPNMLVNAGFEEGLTAWSGDGVWTAVETGVYEGNRAAYAQIPAAGSAQLCQGIDQGRSIAGRSFAATAWLKTSQVTKIRFELGWRDANNNWIRQGKDAVSLTGTNDWTMVSLEGTAPEGATQVCLVVVPAVTDGLGAVWVDQCGLEERPPVNLLLNAGFEEDLDAWSAAAPWSLCQNESHQGSKSALCLVPTGGMIEISQGHDFGRYIEGNDFTASVWIKTEAVTNARLRLCWRDADDNWIWSGVKEANLAGTNPWTWLTVAGTAPLGATEAVLVIDSASPDGTGCIWVDDSGLTEMRHAGLLMNAGFEDGLEAWDAVGAWQIATVGTYYGGKAIEYRVPVGGDDRLAQGYDFDRDIAGTDFIASAWVKTQDVTGMRIRICWKDALGNWIWQDANAVTLSGSNDWSRVIVEGTAPLGATQAWLAIEPAAADGVGCFWVDDCVLLEKPRPNLLLNPGFEDGFSSWQQAAPWSIATDPVFLGGEAAYCQVPATGEATLSQGIDYDRNLEGLTFTASGWFKTLGVTEIVYQLRWRDSGGNWIPSHTPEAALSGTAAWTRLAVEGTAPPGATEAWIVIAPSVPDGTGGFWADGLCLAEKPRPNLLVNPGYEDGLNAWQAGTGWAAETGGRAGAHCAGLAIPAGGSPNLSQGYDYGREIGGAEFLFSAWIKTENVTSVAVKARYKDAAGNWSAGGESILSLSGTRAWERVLIEGTAPAGATQVWLSFEPTVCDGLGTIWVDGGAIEPKTILSIKSLLAASPYTVSFDADFFLPGQISGYEWDFNGDSLPESLQENPDWTFAGPGEYPVGLKAMAADGSVYATVKHVTVPPSLSISVTWSEAGGFVLAETVNYGAQFASATWEFGDGQGLTSPEKQVVHAYRDGGAYTVRVDAVDTLGNPAGTSIIIQAPPSVEAAPSVVQNGLAYLLSANAAVHYGGQVTAILWHFGDGETGTGATAEHVYHGRGTYTPVVEITDSFGYTHLFTAPTVTVDFVLSLSLTGGQICQGPTVVQAEAVYDGEVTSIAILVDGQEKGVMAGKTIAIDWDTFLSANGTHVVTVKAILPGGQEYMLDRTVTVSNPVYRVTMVGI